jgi:hypothetical protein
MEDVIDSTMASATARFASGVNPKHLSKIWRISHEDAERTLDNHQQDCFTMRNLN